MTAHLMVLGHNPNTRFETLLGKHYPLRALLSARGQAIQHVCRVHPHTPLSEREPAPQLIPESYSAGLFLNRLLD